MSEKKAGPNIGKLVIVLTLVCAITSAILGGVNAITCDRIAQITKAKTDAALAEVLPIEANDSYTELSDFTADSTVTHVWTAEAGTVVEMNVSGAQGMIDLVVGVDKDGTVTGVSIISHGETPGLGAKATENSFRDQFIGATGSVAVDKDGGSIQALTGATITSRAIANAVNTAIDTAATLG